MAMRLFANVLFTNTQCQNMNNKENNLLRFLQIQKRITTRKRLLLSFLYIHFLT